MPLIVLLAALIFTPSAQAVCSAGCYDDCDAQADANYIECVEDWVDCHDDFIEWNDSCIVNEPPCCPGGAGGSCFAEHEGCPFLDCFQNVFYNACIADCEAAGGGPGEE